MLLWLPQRYVTQNISELALHFWNCIVEREGIFTCHWIKVSAGGTVARAREMLTLLALHSDTINCLQLASLDLNKSSQRWPQGRSSRDDRTWWSHLSLESDHLTWGEANWKGKVQNLWRCPGGMYNCSGMNREGQGPSYSAWIILLSTV